jgi:hypothetical protein
LGDLHLSSVWILDIFFPAYVWLTVFPMAVGAHDLDDLPKPATILNQMTYYYLSVCTLFTVKWNCSSCLQLVITKDLMQIPLPTPFCSCVAFTTPRDGVLIWYHRGYSLPPVLPASNDPTQPQPASFLFESNKWQGFCSASPRLLRLLFGWLVAGAGLFWEKSTAGWLLVAGSFWEKSNVGWWLISRANRLELEIPVSEVVEDEKSPHTSFPSQQSCR